MTDINLAGGDITHIVSEKMLGAEYSALRDAHQESVKQAQDIVERNIKILVSLIKDIGDRLGALPTPTDGPFRKIDIAAAPSTSTTESLQH